MHYMVAYEVRVGECQAAFWGTLGVTSREIAGSVSGHNCYDSFTGTLRTRVN
jgi:hypothetical protein